MRPRPQGASVLSKIPVVKNRRAFEIDRTSLLIYNGLGVSISILFDGRYAGVVFQERNVIIGEVSSKSADDIPLVRDL